MATIVTRAGKGSELTHTEVDANFTNLNAEVGGKQATLVSGTNIKTINGTSLLDAGNVALVSQAQYDTDMGDVAAALDLINGV